MERVDSLLDYGQRGYPFRDLVHHRVQVAVADAQRRHDVLFTHLARATAGGESKKARQL